VILVADLVPRVHYVVMSFTATSNQTASPAVEPSRPERGELLASMLDQTARGGVPIRRAFLQRSQAVDGTRASALASLVRARDEAALDAYLLIHAMASSSAPFRTWFPVSTWAQVAGFDLYASPEAAKARWSKIATKLTRLNLVRRERSGNRMNYWLLNESGNGEDYLRPRRLSHGSWFSIPHTYWTEGYDQSLNLAEKTMLLIALDQPDGSRLPYDQMPQWYGISAKTAERGLTSLVKKSFLEVEATMQIAPKSPTGWTEIRRYTALGPWSIDSRKSAIVQADRHRKPAFIKPSEPSAVKRRT